MATEANIELIRKNNSYGVTPYHDAVVFHSAIGHDYQGRSKGVIYKGVYNEFACAISGRNAEIRSGMGQLFGRQFVIPAGKKVTVSMSSYASGYVTVFVTIDASTDPETISITSSWTSTIPGIESVLVGANLYKNETGTSSMPLYTFVITGGDAHLARDYRHIREPGVAEEALSIPGNGRIRSNLVSDLVEENSGYAKKARWSDEAGTTSKVSGIPIDSHLQILGKYGLVNCSTVLGNMTDTIPQNGYFNLSRSGTKGTGVPLGFMWYSFLKVYWSDNDVETVTATGYVGEMGTFYLTKKSNVSEMPSTGICYEQDNYCYAKVQILPDKVTVTALVRFTYGSTVNGNGAVRFMELYAGV